VGRSIRLVVMALVAALAVAACGGKEDTSGQAAAPGASSPTVVDDGTLAAGEKNAAPLGEVVLAVTGAIGAHNKGRRLEFDLASLERMRRVRLEAAEPLLKRRVMFEGVLLSDLLAVAGVPETASKVSLTALDDYKVDFRSRTCAAPRCCWPPRPTASTCRSTGRGRSGSCSPTAPASAATRTCGEEFRPPATCAGPRCAGPCSGNQLHLLDGLGVDGTAVGTAVTGIGRDLAVIDRALARARADPSDARLRAEVVVMRPAIRRVTVRIKELYDAKEQEFFGAIDDFGTGYSSLSYLRHFPIDMLKIDKAFVDGIAQGREDTALANAIVKLSHTLQLYTVAEGIEHAGQAAHLATLGCQDGQGFHFARPLPTAGMTELLAKSLADGAFHLPTTAQPAGSLSV
jgi:EAL domain